jgi:predicted nucleic acid-binding protein
MFVAVLDTCVLYPAYLRDTLLRLADAEMYAPVWSVDILDELRRNLQSVIDVDGVDRVVREMNGAFPDACVTDYSHLVDEQTCDKKDRHVVAAAVVIGAGVIVTANAKDFPDTSVKRYDIEIKTPDEFCRPNMSCEFWRFRVLATSSRNSTYWGS